MICGDVNFNNPSSGPSQLGVSLKREEMNEWSIGNGHSARLTIQILTRPANDSGYDWIEACVSISAGRFSGQFRASLLLRELISFLSQLEVLNRDLKGEAEISTIEDQVHLKLSMDHSGHYTGSGYVMDEAGTGNKLIYTICGDQTEFPITIRELSQAIEKCKRADNQPL